METAASSALMSQLAHMQTYTETPSLVDIVKPFVAAVTLTINNEQ